MCMVECLRDNNVISHVLINPSVCLANSIHSLWIQTGCIGDILIGGSLHTFLGRQKVLSELNMFVGVYMYVLVFSAYCSLCEISLCLRGTIMELCGQHSETLGVFHHSYECCKTSKGALKTAVRRMLIHTEWTLSLSLFLEELYLAHMWQTCLLVIEIL